MKNRLLFWALMFLMGVCTAVNAQVLTVSDVQNSGCMRSTRARANENEETQTIVLTKEGDILTVQLLGFKANCAIEGFDVTPSVSDGNDGTSYSVSIGVEPFEPEVVSMCVCPYNVSFSVHGLETNSFHFSCWWYSGQVNLTEGEPLTLESITEYANIDGFEYIVEKVSHTASFVGMDAGITGIEALKDVSIPSETEYEGQKYVVTSIGERAFMNSSCTTSLAIPGSVTNIKDYALAYCSSLIDVYCYAENVPTTGVNVFTESSIASATLHVPAGSLEKYKTTSPWSEFGNIVALPIPQDDDYRPFVEEGKVWHYEVSNPNAGSEHYSEWLTYYMLEGDTIIGNYNCKKLYVTSNCPFNKCERQYSGALFEKDSLVYHIYPNGTEPYLLYDFTPQEGDDVSIGGTTLTIRERQKISYNGKSWLVLTWSPKEFDVYKSILIEGVGCHDNEILNYYDSWNPGAYRCKLLSCEVNGKEIFSFKTFPLVNEPVTFTKDQMATIILPTAPDASKGKYYKLDRVEDDQIIFEQELQPQARTPYIIVPNEDFSIDPNTLDLEELRFDTVKIEAVSPLDPSLMREVRFVGTYKKQYIGMKDNGLRFYILDTTSDCIYKPEGKASIIMGALRAHFEVSLELCYDRDTRRYWEELEYVLHDTSTSIMKPSVLSSDKNFFDLQGRHLSGKPACGINILRMSDGTTRKVLIK